MVKALNWPLYLHPNLTKLNRGKEVRKVPTKVKHGKSVPLVRANLKLPCYGETKHKWGTETFTRDSSIAKSLRMKPEKYPSPRSHCPSKWCWKKALMQVIKPQVTPLMSMMILKYLVVRMLRSSMSSWGLGDPLNALMFLQRSSTTRNTFKKRGVLCHLGVFKPKNGKGPARVMSKKFNLKDLRANPQGEGLMRSNF